MCLKQRFPGGHSLRLAFWSFIIIYRRILAVLLSVKFSLFSLCWLTLGFCSIPASSQFWPTILAARSTWRWPWLLCACFFYFYTPSFETPTTSWRRFFLRDEPTVVLHSHPLLVLNSRWGRAVISTCTFTCLFSCWSSLSGRMVWDSAIALASLGFCVIVPSGFT